MIIVKSEVQKKCILALTCAGYIPWIVSIGLRMIGHSTGPEQLPLRLVEHILVEKSSKLWSALSDFV